MIRNSWKPIFSARGRKQSWGARALRRWVAPAAAVLSFTSFASAQSIVGSDCDTGHGVECHCPGCDSFLQQYGAPAPMMSPGQLGGDGTATPTPAEGTAGQPAPVVDSGSIADEAASASGAPEFNSMAGLRSDLGAGYGLETPAPSIIGDFFGGGFQYGPAFNNATVGIAGGDRRFKLTENNSPFPMNRVFFNYNHFHNALTNIQGDSQDLNRYLFGVERAFSQGLYSVELRVPFAGTMDATQDLGSAADATVEFGNMAVALKGLLYRDSTRALSGGMGMIFPTGSDAPLLSGGSELLTFDNGSINLQPFLGYFAAPSERWFHQFFCQLDFDTTGNDVIIPAGSQLLVDSFGPGITRTLQDQTLLMLDYSYGYWLHKNPQARYVHAVAGMVELHYTTTLQNLDLGGLNNDPELTVSQMFATDAIRRDVLNLTAGFWLQIGRQSGLKIAAVTPLRDGADKLFDTELGLQFIRLY